MKFKEYIAVKEYLRESNNEAHQAVFNHVLDNPDLYDAVLRDAFLKGWRLDIRQHGGGCWIYVYEEFASHEFEIPIDVVKPYLIPSKVEEAINHAIWNYLTEVRKQALDMVLQGSLLIHNELLDAFRNERTSDDPSNSRVVLSSASDDYRTLSFTVVPSLNPPSTGSPLVFSLPAEIFDTKNDDELDMDSLRPIIDF